MSRTLQDKKTVGELPLFRSISIFMTHVIPIILNVNKDIKVTLGYTIIKDLVSSLKMLRKAYQEKCVDKKYACVNELYGIISDIEILFKLMFELKFISLKQQANVSIEIGDIMMQLNGWKKSIENVIENNNNKSSDLNS